MPRFVVSVQELGGETGGWQATITCPDLQPAPIARTLRELGTGDAAFPLPPFDEPMANDGSDLHRALCQATAVATLEEVRMRLAAKQPRHERGEVEAFGRYLFTTLLGGAWETMRNAAAGAGIDLALRWPVNLAAFSRLPWEMLHGPDDRPLALNVGITRVVADPSNPPGRRRRVCIAPRVLFVVGTDLNDEKIRPGAEFFGVVERLDATGAVFDFQVLQRATSAEVEEKLLSFRPSIVHFICHGGVGSEGGYLELTHRAADGKVSSDKRSADRLLDLLRAGGQPPPVVVLNACFSATTPGQAVVTATRPVAQVPPALATALVAGGVAMVVGMGGRVADHACRLFTERFYAAIFAGSSVAEAAAAARRAGLLHGTDPRKTVDWAFPALFLADGVEPEFELDDTEAKRIVSLAQRASTYRGPWNPRPFCGRLHLIEQYERLVRGGNKPTLVLAIDMADSHPGVPGARFGKTRALKELAARAARDGHLPCIVTYEKDPPRRIDELAGELARSLRYAWHVSFPGEPLELQLKMLATKGQEPGFAVQLEREVEEAWEFWRLGRRDEHSGTDPFGGSVVAAALRSDLVRIETRARQVSGRSTLRVLLLLDDLHRFDSLAHVVLDQLVGPDGVGPYGHPIPFIFSYSAVLKEPAHQPALDVIERWIGENGQGPYLARSTLKRFASTEAKPLANVARDPLALIYQQYLLNLDPPLVFHPGIDEDDVRACLEDLHHQIQGVPSNLAVPENDMHPVKAVIGVYLRQQFGPTLVPANPDAVLAHAPDHP